MLDRLVATVLAARKVRPEMAVGVARPELTDTPLTGAPLAVAARPGKQPRPAGRLARASGVRAGRRSKQNRSGCAPARREHLED